MRTTSKCLSPALRDIHSVASAATKSQRSATPFARAFRSAHLTALATRSTPVTSTPLFAAAALCVTGCDDGKNGDQGSAPATTTQGQNQEQPSQGDATEPASATFEDGATLGEGATQFTFTVVDADGNETTATVSTDAETLGQALLDLGVIAGEDSDYGLYVKTVNGETLDYDKDGAYWALYVGDQYATTGVDSTELEPGETYSFKAEK